MSLSDAQEFDPDESLSGSDSFNETHAKSPSNKSIPVKPVKRCGHVSVAVGENVIVWGGYTEDNNANTPAFERYLPAEDVWIYRSDIHKWFCHKTSGNTPPGLSGACAVVVNHAMYVLCGHRGQEGCTNDVYKLNLQDWSWSKEDKSDQVNEDDRIAALPSPRDKFTAWEYEYSVYIFGGYGLPIDWFLHQNGEYKEDSASGHRGWNNQLFVFNTVTSKWSNPSCQGNVPSPRAAHATTRLDTTVYLFGGRHDTQRLNDLYMLNILTLTWTKITVTSGECPVPRTWHTFTSLNSDPKQIILFGGYSQHSGQSQVGDPLGKPQGDVWSFDVQLRLWRQMSYHNITPRLWHSAVRTTNNDVIVFGGCTSDIFGPAHQQQQQHTNEILIFSTAPKSLLRLSFDASFQLRSGCKPLWDSNSRKPLWDNLPRNLSFVLYNRLKMLESTQVTLE